MQTVTVKGMDEVLKKLNKLAQWSEKDAANLRAIDKRVGEVYNVSLRANIKDSPVDIKVYRGGEKRQTIKRGTLRRSIKTFVKRGRTFAGPKSTKSRTKTNRQNAWFANIVEQGQGFGPSRSRGIFERTQKATNKRMIEMRNRLLRKEYERYMK